MGKKSREKRTRQTPTYGVAVCFDEFGPISKKIWDGLYDYQKLIIITSFYNSDHACWLYTIED